MMRRLLITLFLTLVISAAGIIAWTLVGPGGVFRGVNLNEDTAIVIEKGSRTEDIANLLLKHGVIKNRYAFYTAVLLSGEKGRLRAGEFLIPAHASMMDLIRIMCCGSVIVHSVTFTEGTTVAEAVRRLKELP